ncbi:substrate-binding domain-containing protein [Streptomyces sp. NBC_01390]|uniref:sugar ABC transporter substrate-binding protein n=1 Tax=Streptomyces sp. NBC_01390 TaxID=2903850 RepID=UPI00324825B8
MSLGAGHSAVKRGVPVVVAVGMSLSLLGACGGQDAGGGGSGGGDSINVGVLMPGGGDSRFGRFDRPLIEKQVKVLCPDCPAATVAATSDPTIQQQQFEAMITRGVDVVILAAVDPQLMRPSVEAAHRAGIPVVAYDRLAEGPISGYVTFDGAEVGRLQAEALLKAMSDRGAGRRIVMMNGATTDPNSAWYKGGSLAVLKGKVTIGKSYDTVRWRPENAYVNMTGAIAALGAENIDGVLSANDTMAGAVISALKAAKVATLPPVTGQDADLLAVQRIVRGEQYMTVYKPYKRATDATVEMAVALGRGEKIGAIATGSVDSPTTKDVPAVLLPSVSVTADNIGRTLVKDGMYTVDQICTPALRSACDRAGLT